MKSHDRENAENNKKENEDMEMINYIENAGGCIVTKSLLEGESHFKWLFREDPVHEMDNGWRAFGAEDTKEYVNNTDNMVIVDFNTLVNIEPVILNVYEMPVGTELKFVEDKTGKYFVDINDGQEIREKVKSPVQNAFEDNLEFICQGDYDVSIVERIFTEDGRIKCYELGKCEFTTGNIIVADPLCYLQDSRSVNVLEKTIPAGSYPVILSILFSKVAGLRIAGAKLKVTEEKAVRYELAEPRKDGEEKRCPSLPGFAVEAGMGCFCDEAAAKDYWSFLDGWYEKNQNKNIYDDYFKELFAGSYEAEPEYQSEEGDFLLWNNPETDSQIAMFASGLGDGFYPARWGIDEKGEPCELVILFMNPDLF